MGIETDMGCDTVVAVRRTECGGTMSALVLRGRSRRKICTKPPLLLLEWLQKWEPGSQGVVGVEGGRRRARASDGCRNNHRSLFW